MSANVLTSSRPTTPGSTSTSLTAQAPATPPFHVGLWKVQSAWHKVTNKRVSVWTFDKRGPEVDRLAPPAKERVVEVLKAEVKSSLNLCMISMFIIFLRTGFISWKTAASFNSW